MHKTFLNDYAALKKTTNRANKAIHKLTKPQKSGLCFIPLNSNISQLGQVRNKRKQNEVYKGYNIIELFFFFLHSDNL